MHLSYTCVCKLKQKQSLSHRNYDKIRIKLESSHEKLIQMLCRRYAFLLSVWRLGHSKCYIYVLKIWGMLQEDRAGHDLLFIIHVVTAFSYDYRDDLYQWMNFMLKLLNIPYRLHKPQLYLTFFGHLISVLSTSGFFLYIHVSCWFQLLLSGKSLHIFYSHSFIYTSSSEE